MLDGIRSPLAGLRGPFPTGSGAAALTAALYDIRLRNTAVLASLAPITLSKDIVAYGASLTQGTSGGATNDWVSQMDAFYTNDIDNAGHAGDDFTAIIDVINGSSSNQRPTSLQGGDNILTANTTHTYTGILAGHANLDAALAALTPANTTFWHMGISASQTSSAGTINGATRFRVAEGLKAAYGAGYKPFVESVYKAKPEADFTATEITHVYQGHLPYDASASTPLSGDGTHPSNAANDCLAEEYAWMWAAMDGIATVGQDDIVPYQDDAVETDIVHTMATFGATPAGFEIAAGDPDGLFDINSSGEISVTAAGEGNLTEDYYDLAVKAWPTGSSATSGYRHESAIRLVRAGNSGFGGVNVKRYGALGIVDPPDFTDFTYCIGMKFPAGETGICRLLDTQAQAFSASTTFIQSNGTTQRGRFQWNLKDSSNNVIATRSITNTFTGDAESWFWFMLSYNQSTSTVRSLVARIVSGTATFTNHTPDSGTLTGDVHFGELLVLFAQATSYTGTEPRDCRRLMLFDHAWDLTSNTDRGKFFSVNAGTPTASTLEPVALGASYQIDSIDPFLARDFHGPGDILPSRWVGTGKDKLTINWPHQLGTAQYASAA